MNITVRDVRVDPMFVKLCREHPERVSNKEAAVIDDALRRVKPRVRVKAIGLKIAPGSQCNADSLVANLFSEIKSRGLSVRAACRLSGVGHDTVKYWRTRVPQSIKLLDSMYRALGYKLTVTRLGAE